MLRSIHRWALAACVATLLAPLGLSQTRGAESERPGSGRWALLVGVDDYVRARKLEYCGADMEALAKQLASAGFPQDHVYLLHDKAAQTKYRPMKANIEDHLGVVLGMVGRDDLVIVGFSGHGVHLDGKSYLCPSEAKLDDPQTLISLDDVYARLQRCPAAMKLLVVDACRNDPRPGERSLAPTDQTRQFASSLERPPQGILLLTSCAPGEIAREEKQLGHGVFMHFLLEGLQGRADANQNGSISLMELYLYTNNKTKTYVAKNFVDSQRPALKGDIHDDFDLVRLSAAPSSPVPPPRQITNSIGMKLVLIPAGEFLMGSPDSYRHGNFDPKDEKPQQRVRISKPFFLGAHEVTVGQFRQFVDAVGYKTDAEKDAHGPPGARGFNPSTRKSEHKAEYNWRNPGFEQSDDHPVVNVSWNDAEAFCIWLSKTEPDHPRYRLPSEAEWEYACRAGTTTQYWPGDDPETLAQVDNVADAAAKAKVFELLKETISNSDGHVFTAPVGRFRANGFGLYDVHGNVSEWCADWYYGDLSGAPSGNPPTSPAMSLRVTRGGCWLADPFNARSARRSRAAPRVRETYIGFRVARNP